MSTTNKDHHTQPRFKVAKLDTAIPLTESRIEQFLDGKRGVTLLVRSAKGAQKRGGYFFCIARNEDGTFSLDTMEQTHVADFSLGDLTRFVNHASGLQFDEPMLQYCQRNINFRTDEE